MAKKKERVAIAVFTFALIVAIFSSAKYITNFEEETPAKQDENRETKLLQKCRSCQKEISVSAETCPHCGNAERSAILIFYSLAGFALLLGMQILQIPMQKEEKKYLYMILLGSTVCLTYSALLLGIIIEKEYQKVELATKVMSIFMLLGIFTLVLAIVQLSYYVWAKLLTPSKKTTTTKRKKA